MATLVEDKHGGTLVDRPNQLTVTGQMNTAGKYAWGSLDLHFAQTDVRDYRLGHTIVRKKKLDGTQKRQLVFI